MTIDERLDRLAGIVEALAGSVSGRHVRIEALVRLARENEQEMAYLNTLRKQ